MHYPMILPWLARKAGVSLPTAKRIWDQVLADSERKFAPSLRGSKFWGHAIAEFRQRLRGASRRRVCAPATGADFNNLLWVQGRILCEAMAAWSGYIRGACSAWPRLVFAWQRMQ
ncbi:MAG TPA: hypothetical protein VF104_10825 [Burkholderiales bacterium]